MKNKKLLVTIILLLALLTNTGCLTLGFIKLVQWDQKRWKAMQEQEQKTPNEAESVDD